MQPSVFARAISARDSLRQAVGRENSVRNLYRQAVGRENSVRNLYRQAVGRENSVRNSYRQAVGRENSVRNLYRQAVGRENSVRNSYRQASKASYLYRQSLFADAAEQVGSDLKADVYLCLLPSSLLAGDVLRSKFGGIVVCDNVENVSVVRHTAAPNHPRNVVRLSDFAAEGALSSADKLLAVGEEIAKSLQKYGRPVLVVENFRKTLSALPSELSTQCEQLPLDVKILVISGSVVEGFATFLSGFALLPEDFHLVGYCRFPVESQRDEAQKLIEALGISDRVHLRDLVPYNELLEKLRAAHIGLITNSIVNPNAAVGLPNRLFDFLAAGLPVVTTPMPDVVDLVDRYDLGAVVWEDQAKAWTDAILRVSRSHSRFAQNATSAAKELSWESKEESLMDFLDRPHKVTFISFRDSTRYQRHRRMAESFISSGIEVAFFFYSRNPDPLGMVPGAQYFLVSDLASPDAKVQPLG